MKIVIAGIGKVGAMITRQLRAEGHELTLIDNNPNALEQTIERYDVMSVEGNCASIGVLRSAGIEKADILITSTGEDEINLLCCMTAHNMNPHIRTIARIRNPEYAESTAVMRKQFGLSLVVNPERQAAVEINRLIRLPGTLHREKFANGLVEMIEIKVEENNPMIGKPLYQLSSVVHCQALVCAVVRKGQVIIPDGNFVIEQGDRTFVTAPAINITILLKNLNIKVPKVKTVTIAGGGKICYYLVSLLLREGLHVKIIEKERARCEALAETFENICVVRGDISTQDVMEREHIGNCDALVALTGLDELNITLAIFGASFDVPKVVTKLSRWGNRAILEQLPVGSLVSPKELSCNTIVRYVRAIENKVGAAIAVHTIADGNAEAIEFMASDETRHLGEKLKNVRLKSNLIIATIKRGQTVIFPNGDTDIRVGDRVIVATTGDAAITQLNDIFVR